MARTGRPRKIESEQERTVVERVQARERVARARARDVIAAEIDAVEVLDDAPPMVPSGEDLLKLVKAVTAASLAHVSKVLTDPASGDELKLKASALGLGLKWAARPEQASLETLNGQAQRVLTADAASAVLARLRGIA